MADDGESRVLASCECANVELVGPSHDHDQPALVVVLGPAARLDVRHPSLVAVGPTADDPASRTLTCRNCAVDLVHFSSPDRTPTATPTIAPHSDALPANDATVTLLHSAVTSADAIAAIRRAPSYSNTFRILVQPTNAPPPHLSSTTFSLGPIHDGLPLFDPLPLQPDSHRSPLVPPLSPSPSNPSFLFTTLASTSIRAHKTHTDRLTSLVRAAHSSFASRVLAEASVLSARARGDKVVSAPSRGFAPLAVAVEATAKGAESEEGDGMTADEEAEKDDLVGPEPVSPRLRRRFSGAGMAMSYIQPLSSTSATADGGYGTLSSGAGSASNARLGASLPANVGLGFATRNGDGNGPAAGPSTAGATTSVETAFEPTASLSAAVPVPSSSPYAASLGLGPTDPDIAASLRIMEGDRRMAEAQAQRAAREQSQNQMQARAVSEAMAARGRSMSRSTSRSRTRSRSGGSRERRLSRSGRAKEGGEAMERTGSGSGSRTGERERRRVRFGEGERVDSPRSSLRGSVSAEEEDESALVAEEKEEDAMFELDEEQAASSSDDEDDDDLRADYDVVSPPPPAESFAIISPIPDSGKDVTSLLPPSTAPVSASVPSAAHPIPLQPSSRANQPFESTTTHARWQRQMAEARLRESLAYDIPSHRAKWGGKRARGEWEKKGKERGWEWDADYGLDVREEEAEEEEERSGRGRERGRRTSQSSPSPSFLATSLPIPISSRPPPTALGNDVSTSTYATFRPAPLVPYAGSYLPKTSLPQRESMLVPRLRLRHHPSEMAQSAAARIVRERELDRKVEALLTRMGEKPGSPGETEREEGRNTREEIGVAEVSREEEEKTEGERWVPPHLWRGQENGVAGGQAQSLLSMSLRRGG